MTQARTLLLANQEKELETMTLEAIKTNTSAQDTTGRELLFDILSWARPHDSDVEKQFARYYLDTIPGMQADEFGNRWLHIDNSPIAWSCHIDTVAHRGRYQELTLNAATGEIALADKKKKYSLGADDGVGVWLQLEMIRRGFPGLYLFHRGEERGCLGSSWIARNNRRLLENVQAAVAFDRAGYSDVITHQMSGRTCSDKFAQAFADQLNTLERTFDYRPDDTGVYTDTNEYASIVPECSNLSVGYFGQHSSMETTNLYHAEALLQAVLGMDLAALPIDRDPAAQDDLDDYMGRWSRYGAGYGTATKETAKPTARAVGSWDRLETELDEMAELCTEHPYAAAALLRKHGVDAWDLWSACQDVSDDSDVYDYDSGTWRNA